jgi:UDP-glucuronate 4-epimerase
MNYLITGAAGFIGYNLIKSLMSNEKNQIIGLDSLNDYYDVNLKYSRLNNLGIHIVKKTDGKGSFFNFKNFTFYHLDLNDEKSLDNLFRTNKIDVVIHLAAQAGVRYSISHPEEYITNNILAFHKIIDVSKNHGVKNFFYASSSSVYGNHREFKLSEKLECNSPLSLYAATKKSNEILAYSYSNIYRMNTIGLRFFTVYGPYGRPDMALFKFTKNILANQPIEVYNYGKMTRDFTYIGDLVLCLTKLVKKISEYENDGKSLIFNIGNGQPIKLESYIDTLEVVLNLKAKRIYLPMQKGDVQSTYADNSLLKSVIGDYEYTNIDYGVGKFIEWYKEYYYA